MVLNFVVLKKIKRFSSINFILFVYFLRLSSDWLIFESVFSTGRKAHVIKNFQ